MKKRTSDRVSRIAAKLLAKYKALGVSGLEKDWFILTYEKVKWGDVAAMAASCLGQDEVKGKRFDAIKRAGRAIQANITGKRKAKKRRKA